MSLMPSMSSVFKHPFFNSSWWDIDFSTPSRIFDQNFGLALRDEDLFPPTFFHGFYLRPRRAISRQSSGMSEVTNDTEHFKVCLEVNHFLPEELSVKTIDDCVVIEGKHQERSDEHSFVSRSFCRRYYLPSNCKAEDVRSELNNDNILTVSAKKQTALSLPPVERIVPIVRETKPLALPEKASDSGEVLPPTERIITVSSKAVPTPAAPKANTVPIELPPPLPKDDIPSPIELPAAEPSVERIVPVTKEDTKEKPSPPVTPVVQPPAERIVPITKEPQPPTTTAQ